MKENLILTKKHQIHRCVSLMICVLLSVMHITTSFAQGTAGNSISFDQHNSTMLFADLPTTQSQQQKYSCYLRHNQAPIQVLNANPIGNSYTIAPLQKADGTGFFANSSLANNMGFSSDGKVQFYNMNRTQTDNWPGSPYSYICFSVIAPKGYRFTEYWMDIDGTQNNGTSGCTIMRYNYVNGTTFQFEECAGESLDLTDAASQIFNHTLSNATNVLYFRIETSTPTTQLCATLNQFRLKYVIDSEVDVTIPNADGTSIHTGYINFGDMTSHTNSNPNQYFFNKENVTDLEEINIVSEDNTATISLENGMVNVSKAGTYWIESPTKFRFLEAKMNFVMVEGTSEPQLIDRGTNLESILGKPVKIGNGTNFIIANGETSFSNGTQETGTTWIINKVEGSDNKYTIRQKDGSQQYLSLNTSNALQLSNTALEWTYFEDYDNGITSSATGRHQTSDHCFIYINNNNNHYGLQLYGTTWRAIRTNQNRNNTNYIPTPISYTEIVTPVVTQSYTASLYGTDANTVVATANLSSDNTSATLTASGLNNDGIKFTVSGPAAFTVDLSLIPLDPNLQHLEFGYMQNGVVADEFVSAGVNNFQFNDGNAIIIPLAIVDGGNGDSHQIVFRGAYNENRTPWYDGTGSGDKTSNYYLVDSEYEKNGSSANAPSDKVDADQAGTVEIAFSNIGDLTSGGGSLTETVFNKSQAGYEDIIIPDGDEQTVYIYTADHPVYMIMTNAGKNMNTHTAYTFYSAKIQTQDIPEDAPEITVTPIYTSTLKGENVKAPVYNQVMGANVSVPKDTSLDTQHVFYGVKVTTGGEGYTTSSAIINAIKAEFSKDEYAGKVYENDLMRTILYIDMSSLKSVSGSTESWREIMLGTADNCLFFNPEGFDITQDMIGGGIISGGESGEAVTDIVINDQQPFFSPYQFYTSTHVAHYHRNKVNGQDLPNNTTLVLPFSMLLSPEGYLRTASDNVDDKVQFFNLTTTLTTPEDGVEGEVFDVATEPLQPASFADAPLALAFKPYHVYTEEQTETTAYVIEVSGATFPQTPAVGADAFINDDTGMIGYGSLNGVAVSKTEEVFYFSKNYFWNSRTLPEGSSVMVLPYRAYYRSTDSSVSNLNRFGVDFNSYEATAIKDVANENAVKGVYDLSGRRVSDDLQSLSKGVYIINGKKYIVK